MLKDGKEFFKKEEKDIFNQPIKYLLVEEIN